MKSTLEREIKLQAAAGFTLPQFPGTPIGPRRFTSTYFDTEDFRLAAARITLRRRVESRRGVWQLKIPRDTARLELEERGGPLKPPASMVKLLSAPLRGNQLVPVAKLRTVRTGTTVMDGDRRVAEVVFDSVQVVKGLTVVNRFNEIEVELLDGTEDDLQQLGSALRAVGAQDADGRPKLFQALNIEVAKPEPEEPPATDLARIQRMITDQFRTILRHDPGTRLGDDPEDLHQHRVAIRKLRSLLQAAGMLDPGWAESLRSELEWIGDLLNPVRDLDVMIPYFRADTKLLLPDEAALVEVFLDKLRADREIARLKMLKALESDRYLALLNTLETATVSLVVRAVDETLEDGAASRFRKLKKAVDGLGEHPEDEELHRVRRLAKKARYTADLVKPAAGKKVAAYVEDLKGLQDVLGDFQDAVVAEGRVREFLPDVDSPPQAFALGRLAELQAAKRRRVGADFPQAWRKVAKSGRKAWS
ncbi:MAG TPA: CYTH and CHAD domain-containing protein [Actinomycetota bacterium]|nr:CYTH and CHAD domain-containing protein [Actinomycetota bacterium]